MQFISDSLGNGLDEYPSLFAQKLAQKFPAYNVKYALYDYANDRYGAWQNLVTAGGAERHLICNSTKTNWGVKKADISDSTDW